MKINILFIHFCFYGGIALISAGILNASTQPLEVIGPGCVTAYYIDRDCDGYGVEAPLGPDVDDKDPDKHAPVDHEDALNYIPKTGDIFYIAPDGVDLTGQKNNVEQPFKTLNGFKADLGPGDVIVYRNGEYNIYKDGYHLGVQINTKGNPITIMSYPGEVARIGRYIDENTVSGAIAGCAAESGVCGDMIYDGLIFEKSSSGWQFGYSSNITVKNSVARDMAIRGFFAMQDSHNIHITNSIFHDILFAKKSTPSHGIYIGARDKPNSNILIENSIMYRCSRTGFQHNGPISAGLVFRNNIIHSVVLSAISLANGVENAIFVNNIMFNNNKSPIVIQSHHQPDYNIMGQPNKNNTFANNILWTGRDEVGSEPSGSPADFHCIAFDMPQLNSYEEGGRHSGNTFINNICVSYGGAYVSYYNIEDYYASKFYNNIFWHSKTGNNVAVRSKLGDGSHSSLIYNNPYWKFADSLGKDNANSSGNIERNPDFLSSSLDFAKRAGSFNFKLLDGSIAIDNGISAPYVPDRDFEGNARINSVDIGVYESGGTPANCVSAASLCSTQEECALYKWHWYSNRCNTLPLNPTPTLTNGYVKKE